MQPAVLLQPFNGGDLFSDNFADLSDAGTRRLAID